MSDEQEQVQVRERNTPYRGYMRLDVYRLRHHDFNGGWSIDLSREVLERGNAVAVLPYDPDRDEVVLIEQFRIGAYTASETSPWQIEVVAGMIETHHLAEETAHKETEEETGLNIYDLVPVHHYLSSPGCTSETIRMFCGRVDSTSAGGISGVAHEGEYIRVFTASSEEAFAMLDSGRIENGMTIIALQWLKLNRDRLRDAWLDG
ncbi:MAG: NUDIX domain-containing protein [Rhodospirillales bacterium]|jgi:ADP-ribose pyrophosphatase|nr:ADP-ribose diphosphatase [Rhodospirillaceae bacterium]MDP6430560.1 NUDIX domain-containing protein [Rhodospirillales bacterium]MDP6643733.1 NUDIX domain-containing protein [Rhodospirillales bacterium]MDP6841220.1 NUDIX domain-containing protein [Rhodospirillales bacterium]|tara:strand:- start:914 stop:1528 length:615 start_codon:yes stop_codon:yes gene_type:complete